MKKDLLERLAYRRARMTGDQVRFIRLHFNETAVEFGRHFGVKGPKVLSWEKTKHREASMPWTTEIVLRLLLLTFINKTSLEIHALFKWLLMTNPIAAKTLL